MTSARNASNALRAKYPRGIVSTGCAVAQQLEDYGRETDSSGGEATAIVKAKPVLDRAATTKAGFEAIKARRSRSAERSRE